MYITDILHFLKIKKDPISDSTPTLYTVRISNFFARLSRDANLNIAKKDLEFLKTNFFFKCRTDFR